MSLVRGLKILVEHRAAPSIPSPALTPPPVYNKAKELATGTTSQVPVFTPMEATETVSILVLAVSKYISHINIAIFCICTMTLGVVYQANMHRKLNTLFLRTA